MVRTPGEAKAVGRQRHAGHEADQTAPGEIVLDEERRQHGDATVAAEEALADVGDPAQVLDPGELPRLRVGDGVEKITEQRQIGAEVDERQTLRVLRAAQAPVGAAERVFLGVQRCRVEARRSETDARDRGVQLAPIQLREQVVAAAVVEMDRPLGALAG